MNNEDHVNFLEDMLNIMLDDDSGISERAYELIVYYRKGLGDTVEAKNLDGILSRIQATNGRYYIAR